MENEFDSWNERYKNMLVSLGWTESDLAKLHELSPGSLASIKTRHKAKGDFPRWMKTVVTVFEAGVEATHKIYNPEPNDS